MYERKLKKKQMLSQNKLGTLITLRDLVWRKNEAKNIFAEASLPFFFNSADVKWCQVYMSNLFETYFTFFFRL